VSKPTVAIVGRPNVGKSTFFNYIIGKRISIVEDTPGVTRDRVYADCNWRGREFTVIDTAGIEKETDDVIVSGMREQVNIAIGIALLYVFNIFGGPWLGFIIPINWITALVVGLLGIPGFIGVIIFCLIF